ncbi:hypothetical protein HanXRQr2_Chr08g0342201 [Helianthus annuus]|uniref:Uncharacterized protein n=1 Tax=Helianthus annuus TaxID=4232 RepID=A0A9K3IF04_HELAN|nr:hypothetical protein HanXRQr2_Chr08g0342201 [Helianthus annuus]
MTESPFHRRISMKNKLPDDEIRLRFLVRFIVISSPTLIFAGSFFRSESIRRQCAAAHPPHSIDPLIVFIKHIRFWLRCRQREKWRWKVDKDDSRMRSIRMLQHTTWRIVVKDYVFLFF